MALQFYFCSTDTASHMEIRSRGSCRFPSVKNVQQHDCVNGQAYSGDVKLMRIHIWKGNSWSASVLFLKHCFKKKKTTHPQGPSAASCLDKRKWKTIKQPEKNQSKLTLLCFQSLHLSSSYHLNLNQRRFIVTDYFRWSERHLSLIQMSLQSLPKKSGHPFYSFPTSHLSKDSQATPSPKSCPSVFRFWWQLWHLAAGPSGRSDPIPVETVCPEALGSWASWGLFSTLLR